MNPKIAAAKERAERATPGPWWRCHEDDKRVLGPPDDEHGGDVVIARVYGAEVQDAEFIAHARTDLPLLLAEVEKLVQLISDIHVQQARIADLERQLTEARKSAVEAWHLYNREAKTAGELIHAESERDEIFARLRASEAAQARLRGLLPRLKRYLYPEAYGGKMLREGRLELAEAVDDALKGELK